MDQPETLLACPFCGSNEVSVSTGFDADDEPFNYVECHSCAGMGPFNADRSVAIEAWNRRAGGGRAPSHSGGLQSDAVSGSLPRGPWIASSQYGMHFLLSQDNEIILRADHLPYKMLSAMAEAANQFMAENDQDQRQKP